VQVNWRQIREDVDLPERKTITMDRRLFLATGTATVLSSAATLSRGRPSLSATEPNHSPTRGNRLAVSTYSFWQFRRNDLRDIGKCIDAAAEMGFDGVEILHRQMESEENGYLQSLKRRAFSSGLDLCGFSTHQSFVSPDKTARDRNIEHTQHCIELAYRLGIPTIRVNTGGWGTIKDFDELMEKVSSRAPARRLVTIEEVGAACVFLACDYGAAMTGETLYIDGGYHILA